jgi:hypothetical protein
MKFYIHFKSTWNFTYSYMKFYTHFTFTWNFTYILHLHEILHTFYIYMKFYIHFTFTWNFKYILHLREILHIFYIYMKFYTFYIYMKVRNFECRHLGTDVLYYASRLAMFRWNILPSSSGSVVERWRQHVNPQRGYPLSRPYDFQTHNNTTQDK